MGVGRHQPGAVVVRGLGVSVPLFSPAGAHAWGWGPGVCPCPTGAWGGLPSPSCASGNVKPMLESSTSRPRCRCEYGG